MIEKEHILKLMHIVLLDIRVASHSQDSHTCFVLSDIFHNVPLQMNRADKGEVSYADILKWIQKNAKKGNAYRGLRVLMPILPDCHDWNC